MSQQVSTGCEPLDELLDGGLPRGMITGVDSKPNTGKTWLCYQSCVMVNKEEEQKALYIDTEGDFAVEMNEDRFSGFFEDRFGIEPDINFVERSDLYSLADYLNLDLDFKQSNKSGKFDPKVMTNDLERSSFYNDLEDGDYGIVVLDSMSSPIKGEIPDKNSNRPARAVVQNMIFDRINRICLKRGMIGMITHHTTSNPSMPYKDHGEAWGGRQVSYNTKVQLQLLGATNKQKKKYGEGTKRVLRKRFPGLKQDMTFVKLEEDYGYTEP